MGTSLPFLSLVIVCLVVCGCGEEMLNSSGPAHSTAELGIFDECGERELVEVSDIDGLLDNIGRDHVDVVLAPGQYVLHACQPGESEWGNPTCGQLEQGYCSILRSNLALRTDGHGVPRGGGPEVPTCDAIPTWGRHDGAVIDCGGLPGSGLEFSCVVAGGHGIVSDLTVCNGAPPIPLGPGELDPHRNAIMVLAEREALIEGVRAVNARRGFLFTVESNQTTRGVVRGMLIEATSLAGGFFWLRPPDDSAPPRLSSNSVLEARMESTRVTRAGLHPILLAWAFSGGGNQSDVSFVDNVVDAPSVFGLTVQGVGAGVNDNRVFFEVRGGNLAGGRGVYIASFDSNGSNNQIVGDVNHVTLSNGVPALGVVLLGTNNGLRLDFDHNRYVSDDGSGLVQVLLDEGNHLELSGSAHTFGIRNHNFDVTAALPYLTD